jgi:hypothetical protein
VAAFLHLTLDPVACPRGDPGADKSTNRTTDQRSHQSTSGSAHGGSNDTLILFLAHVTEHRPGV